MQGVRLKTLIFVSGMSESRVDQGIHLESCGNSGEEVDLTVMAHYYSDKPVTRVTLDQESLLKLRDAINVHLQNQGWNSVK